jgi:catechol 2,3-dioxygenase-like lactoylglutathione lyase family enzyme
MFDHVSIKVRDFSRSLAFYRAALAPLGFVAQDLDENGRSVGFGPRGRVGLWISEGTPSSSAHIAFSSPDRARVAAFYDAALGAGGTDNGGPDLRPDYAKDYYAAFVRDPDGNNIEAVTMVPA